LEGNIEKSQIVTAEVPEELKERLVALTGSQLGVVPFKYLGVAVKP